MHPRNVNGPYASGDMARVNTERLAKRSGDLSIMLVVKEGQALQKLTPEDWVVQRIPSHGRRPYAFLVHPVLVGAQAVPPLHRTRLWHEGVCAPRP